MAVTRGEVWMADLAPTVGSEQSGIRPVLIVQTDRANTHSPQTNMIPFTSRIRQRLLPSYVLVPREKVVSQDSVALAEQIRAIDLVRLNRKLGRLPDPRIVEVDQALRTILGL
jgi:mRNA interferase MazF